MRRRRGPSIFTFSLLIFNLSPHAQFPSFHHQSPGSPAERPGESRGKESRRAEGAPPFALARIGRAVARRTHDHEVGGQPTGAPRRGPLAAGAFAAPYDRRERLPAVSFAGADAHPRRGGEDRGGGGGRV